MKETKCEHCKVRPAIKGDILCEECFDYYANRLRSARHDTSGMNTRLVGLDPQNAIPVASRRVESSGKGTVLESQVAEQPLSAALLAEQQVLPPQLLRERKQPSILVGYFLLAIGLVTLIGSVLVASTILAFIGLGLAFWGLLAFFVQPQRYVKPDLMSATALSSLRTVDKMLIGIGYSEKGVYIPAGKEKVVVFVPSEPFSRIPEGSAVEGKTVLESPQGILMVPPGLALASLIEKKLGFALKNAGVEAVVQSLPKVLTEDLEIARDVDVSVMGDRVEFKLVDNIYADFCREVQETSRRCGLGCPMCSALACILAVASGKPVLFEEDKLSRDKRTTYSSYELLNRTRL